MDSQEYYRIKLAIKLTESLHLSVKEVMQLNNCTEEEANRYMHDLVLIGLASWNPIDGRLDFNILFTD